MEYCRFSKHAGSDTESVKLKIPNGFYADKNKKQK